MQKTIPVYFKVSVTVDQYLLRNNAVSHLSLGFNYMYFCCQRTLWL